MPGFIAVLFNIWPIVWFGLCLWIDLKFQWVVLDQSYFSFLIRAYIQRSPTMQMDLELCPVVPHMTSCWWLTCLTVKCYFSLVHDSNIEWNWKLSFWVWAHTIKHEGKLCRKLAKDVLEFLTQSMGNDIIQIADLSVIKPDIRMCVQNNSPVTLG